MTRLVHLNFIGVTAKLVCPCHFFADITSEITINASYPSSFLTTGVSPVLSLGNQRSSKLLIRIRYH